MRLIITMHLVCTSGLLGLGSNAGAQGTASDEFLAWARDALHPLAATDMSAPMSDLVPLGGMIGEARIVAYAEAGHGAAEPLALRNRLFKYLVEEQGFNAIALESGIVESEILYDYVMGGTTDLDRAASEGFSWTFDTLPQNSELLAWMRAYNANRSGDDKIGIYGFDVPGSPGNADVSHGPEVGLERTLRYLDVVDPDSASAFRRRVGVYMPRLQTGYTAIEQPDRDTLTVAISDLIALIEHSQSDYTSRSSAREYRWVHRAAVGARQVDSWLRQLPVGWDMSDGIAPLERAGDLRNRAMADNLDWIVQELGPEARLLVFGAFGHVASTPIRLVEQSIPGGITFGMHAKQRYGDEFLTIGTFMGGGVIGNCGQVPLIPMTDAPSQSVDGALSKLDVPLFILDLRAAPAPVATWLSGARDHWGGFGTQRLRLSEAFDLIAFVKSFSPACR